MSKSLREIKAAKKASVSIRHNNNPNQPFTTATLTLKYSGVPPGWSNQKHKKTVEKYLLLAVNKRWLVDAVVSTRVY